MADSDDSSGPLGASSSSDGVVGGGGHMPGVYDDSESSSEPQAYPSSAGGARAAPAGATARASPARGGGGGGGGGGARAAAVDSSYESYSAVRPEERRGIYDYSDGSDYLTTNDKVEEVMGKVKDVLSREVLMGEGYADASVAEQIIAQLTSSISVLMRDETGGPHAASAPGERGRVTAGDFDASSVTGTDVLFSEADSEVGYNPLSRAQVRSRASDKGKRDIPWSLKLWDLKLVEMRSHAQTSQQKLEKRARRAALEEKRAAKREHSRRRRLLEAAGYEWVGKFDTQPAATLREWESTFGERLRKYDERKADSLAKLGTKIAAVQERKESKSRPPRLEKVTVEEDGETKERYAWVHGNKVDLVDESLALNALDDDTWVFKRLMVRARDREETLERKKFLAAQQKASRELEECFFAPQIRTTVNMSSPKPKDRARELGYALKPTASKRKPDEEAYPFSPAINQLSRRMVQADLYRSTEEVVNRLAQPRKTEPAPAPAADDSSVAEATFQPQINRRSSAMAREVTVYDRLYNIGMQQILEKKRLQSDFWDNYTRLDKPASLRLPTDPFAGFAGSESAFAAAGLGNDETSFGPYDGTDNPDLTRSLALDRTRGAEPRAPRSMADVLAGSAADASALLPVAQQQEVAIGMSPAEFLAVYSR